MAIRTSVFIIALVVFFSTATIAATPGDMVILGSDYRSAQWSACGFFPNSTDSTVQAPFRTGWTSLRLCASLSLFAAPQTKNASVSNQCVALLPNASKVTATAGCPNMVAVITASYWCGVGTGTVDGVIAALSSLRAKLLAQTGGVFCNATNATRTLAALDLLIGTPMATFKVKLACSEKGAILIPCAAGDNNNNNNPLTYGPDALQFPVRQCVNGLAVKCSYCEPYVAVNLVTQPYVFILFPGMKLIIIKLFELFILVHFLAQLRRRTERYVQTLEPPLPNFDPGFVDYVMGCLLRNGTYRIRWRLTYRNPDGIDYLKKMYEKFKREGGDSCEIPPPGKPYSAYIHDNGVVLQRATNCKIMTYRVVEQILDRIGMPEAVVPKAALVRDDIRRWYYGEVTRGGELMITENMEEVLKALEENIREQLELFTWERRRLRVLQYAPLYEKTTTESQSPMRTRSNMKGRGSPGGPATRLQKSEAKVAQEVETELEGVEGKRDLSEFGKEEELITLSFRHLRNSQGCSRVEYFCEVRPDMKMIAVKHALAVALAEFSGFELDNETAKTYDMENFVHLYSTKGYFLDVTDATALELKHISEGSLCFHFTVYASQLTVDVNDKSIFDAFVPIQTQLELTRKKFLDLKLRLPSFRYPEDYLRDDTSKSLSRLFDDRFRATAAGVLLTLCGEEVVYECDLEDSERYYLRDRIPQLAKFNKHLHQHAPKHCPRALSNTSLVSNASMWEKDALQHQPHHDEHDPYYTSFHNDSITTHGDCKTDGGCPSDPPSHDAIAPMSPAGSNPLDDPVVRSYYRCYDHLEQQVDSNGDVHYGVRKVFAGKDQQAARQLLIDMYKTVETRVALEGGELDDATCRWLLATDFKEGIDDCTRLVRIVQIQEQVYLSVFSINMYMLAFQIAFGVAFMIMCIMDSFSATTNLPESTEWLRYEFAYLRFINSGTPASIMSSSILHYMVNHERRAGSKMIKWFDRAVVAFSFLLVSPVVVTHVIPGLVLYIYVVLGAAILLMLPVLAFGRFTMHMRNRVTSNPTATEKETRAAKQTFKAVFTTFLVLLYFVGIIVMTAIFQTTFNWAYLFYNRNYYMLDYISTLSYEWDPLESTCRHASLSIL